MFSPYPALIARFYRKPASTDHASAYGNAQSALILAKSMRLSLLVIVVLVLSAGGGVHSQVRSTDGSTATGIAPGAPAGAYSLGGLDNVNLYNGNVDIRLLLGDIGGRGGAHYSMTLPFNIKGWRVRKTYDRINDRDKFFPFQDWWSGGGNYRPGYILGRQVAVESALDGCLRDPYGNPLPWPAYTLTRFTFTAPDGTEYELRDQATNGQPLYRIACFTGASRGTTFVSADGSGMTFISDTAIIDYVGIAAQTIAPSGYLMFRNGTKYRVDNARVSWIRDSNGNRLTFTYDGNGLLTTITDSLNRQVTIAYNVEDSAPYGLCDQISFKGFAGAQRIIRVSKANLSDALRAGYAIQNLAQLFPELNGASSSYIYNPQMVSAVWLPDGRRYQFFYNSYAEPARVVLPTGGAIEYDMASGSGALEDSWSLDWEIYRRVAERRIYPDGGTGATYAERTVFSAVQSGPGAQRPWSTTVTVDHFNAGSTQVLSREKHYFNGSGLSSLFPLAGYPGDSRFTLYPAWTDSHEYQTEAIDPSGAGTTVLQRATLTWQQRAPVSWWTSGADTAPPNDPRIAETTTTIEPNAANLVARRTFAYDDSVPYNNQSEVYEYDYGVGAAGPLMRRMHTDYVTAASYTDAIAGVHMRSLPLQTSIYDAGGIERARTSFEFDNYGTDSNHATLQTYPRPGFNELGISGLDSAFNSSTSNLTRGNATATTRYLLLNGSVTGSVSAYAQYDIAGNVVKAIDARGNPTTFDFSDRFGTPDGEARANTGSQELNTANQYSYALPTLVTNALGHVTYTQFDYYVGRPVDAEDPNGVVSSLYSENDLLDRPTRIIRAANQSSSVKSQSPVSYDDANRIITGTSDQTTFNDPNPLTSQTLYDGLGRTIEGRQYEGGSNYIVVQTQYDALGRAYNVSNPFRPWKYETPVWTTSAFDALGRVISVTTPDNAVVGTAYSGDRVLVTDQSGKQRISRTNALGQLTDVWEVTAPESGVTESISFPGHAEVTAGYRTSYSYDTLGNLVQVTQGSQQRFFGYDSLSRLVRARNPEQSVNASLPAFTEPLSGNSRWSMAYTYDNNGNLLTRIDARNVTSSNAYDALNRNTSVTYTNDPANTPAITRTYDGATKGIGRLWSTQTNGNSASTTTIESYDAMGRPLRQRLDFSYQVGGYTALKSYIVQRTYDLAGHVKTQTYPSGHSVTYNYDDAGRLADRNGQPAFTGNLGDGVTRTYANEFQYTAWNSVEQEKFGTDTPLYHKQRFNQRGQLWDMRLSTVSFTSDPANGDRGAIANYYSNSFVQGGTGPDNNGNLLRQETYIPGSSFFQDNFAYDSLNRLTSISEKLNGSGNDTFKQAYTYDRWGNRTIDQANTTSNVPHPAYTVDPSNNNRLLAPAGYTHLYDAAGNQTRDTYTNNNSIGNRTFDAENRMTAEQFPYGKGSTWAYYTYNGDGQRVRRNPAGYEIWQVYGFDGELLAEYPQTGPSVAVAQPQKEYGYRNGQLLLTAEAFANRAWNMPATQTDNYSSTTTADKAVNGDVDGGLSNGSTSATNSHPNSWWQVDLQSVKQIDSITVWGRTDCCPEMASNFYVFVSDNPFTSYDLNTTINQSGVSNYYYSGFAGPASINVNRTGRYVRVQLAGTQSLALGEVQVWGAAAKVNWLVTDQLGTPRMIVDKTGSTAGISRHDYLPFGEEVFAGTGGRTTSQGYTATDTVRQKFTGYEADGETGLNFAQARYQSGGQGRFTSVDPVMASGNIFSPQNLNGYSYTANNPLNLVDPSGLVMQDPQNPPLIPSDEDIKKADVTGAVVRININLRLSDGKYLSDMEVAVLYPFANLTRGRPAQQGSRFALDRSRPTPSANPAAPTADGFDSSTLGFGPVSVGGIVDSNNQIYPTFGLGYSTGPTAPGVPNPSYTQTHGSGPVAPGVYLVGTASSGLAVNYSVNLLTGDTQREVGYGTPNYGAGVQVVLPRLEGTTPYDWDRHPDNPQAKHRTITPVGRCPY